MKASGRLSFLLTLIIILPKNSLLLLHDKSLSSSDSALNSKRDVTNCLLLKNDYHRHLRSCTTCASHRNSHLVLIPENYYEGFPKGELRCKSYRRKKTSPRYIRIKNDGGKVYNYNKISKKNKRVRNSIIDAYTSYYVLPKILRKRRHQCKRESENYNLNKDVDNTGPRIFTLSQLQFSLNHDNKNTTGIYFENNTLSKSLNERFDSLKDNSTKTQPNYVTDFLQLCEMIMSMGNRSNITALIGSEARQNTIMTANPSIINPQVSPKTDKIASNVDELTITIIPSILTKGDTEFSHFGLFNQHLTPELTKKIKTNVTSEIKSKCNNNDVYTNELSLTTSIPMIIYPRKNTDLSDGNDDIGIKDYNEIDGSKIKERTTSNAFLVENTAECYSTRSYSRKNTFSQQFDTDSYTVGEGTPSISNKRKKSESKENKFGTRTIKYHKDLNSLTKHRKKSFLFENTTKSGDCCAKTSYIKFNYPISSTYSSRKHAFEDIKGSFGPIYTQCKRRYFLFRNTTTILPTNSPPHRCPYCTTIKRFSSSTKSQMHSLHLSAYTSKYRFQKPSSDLNIVVRLFPADNNRIKKSKKNKISSSFRHNDFNSFLFVNAMTPSDKWTTLQRTSRIIPNYNRLNPSVTTTTDCCECSSKFTEILLNDNDNECISTTEQCTSPVQTLSCSDINDYSTQPITSSIGTTNHLTPSTSSTANTKSLPPSISSTAYTKSLQSSTANTKILPPSISSTAYTKSLPPSTGSTAYKKSLPPSISSTAFTKSLLSSTANTKSLSPTTSSTANTNSLSPSISSTAYTKSLHPSTVYTKSLPPSISSTAYTKSLPPSISSAANTKSLPPSISSAGNTKSLRPSTTEIICVIPSISSTANTKILTSSLTTNANTVSLPPLISSTANPKSLHPSTANTKILTSSLSSTAHSKILTSSISSTANTKSFHPSTANTKILTSSISSTANTKILTSSISSTTNIEILTSSVSSTANTKSLPPLSSTAGTKSLPPSTANAKIVTSSILPTTNGEILTSSISSTANTENLTPSMSSTASTECLCPSTSTTANTKCLIPSTSPQCIPSTASTKCIYPSTSFTTNTNSLSPSISFIAETELSTNQPLISSIRTTGSLIPSISSFANTESLIPSMSSNLATNPKRFIQSPSFCGYPENVIPVKSFGANIKSKKSRIPSTSFCANNKIPTPSVSCANTKNLIPSISCINTENLALTSINSTMLHFHPYFIAKTPSTKPYGTNETNAKCLNKSTRSLCTGHVINHTPAPKPTTSMPFKKLAINNVLTKRSKYKDLFNVKEKFSKLIAMEKFSAKETSTVVSRRIFDGDKTKRLSKALHNLGFGEDDKILPFNNTTTSVEEYVEYLNYKAENMYRKYRKALWDYETNITHQTRKKSMVSSLEMTQFQRNINQALEPLKSTEIGNSSLERQIKLLYLPGMALLPDYKITEFEQVLYAMSTIYNTATVNEWKYPAHRVTLNPVILKRMAKSQDVDELKYYWLEWRKVTGRRLRSLYQQNVELMNMSAHANGFPDAGEMWTRRYETEDFMQLLGSQWEDIRPLYSELHAYVRHSLHQAYGDVANATENGLIPVHLTGDIWGRDWRNLYPMIVPYHYDHDKYNDSIAKKYTVKKMVEEAERMFHSLGFPSLPPTFWSKSVFKKSNISEMNCKPSVWDMLSPSDYRMKICADIKLEDFFKIHELLAKVEYFTQYKDLPFPFKDEANPSFSDAIAGAIVLSAKSKKHLETLNISPRTKENSIHDINFLMGIALEKLAFLPFSYIVDLWRMRVFQGDIESSEYNKKWWDLRVQYQGVSPPEKRTEEDFDIGSIPEVATNEPYIKHFLSTLLEFQIHEALCDKAGYSGDLHNCDITSSAKAGHTLRKVMSMGSSYHWRVAMKELTGERRLDSGAMLKYFHPLHIWLREKNIKHGQRIGWQTF